MSFFALLLALLFEQVRPLKSGNFPHATLRAWVRWSSRNFDAGERPHAWFAWSVAVLLPSFLALALHYLLLAALGWFAAMVWSVAVLYATLGFRQFSHHFTGIRDALDAGDEATARRLLAQWQQIDARDLPRREILRLVIEHSVVAAHRHVFGVLCWFSVLAALGLGPAGAVLYRLAEFVPRYWRHSSSRAGKPVSQALRARASALWYYIDWPVARVTAMGFAVVGSFEEAVDSWRNYESQLGHSNDGLLVAATAGAVNVRLGEEAQPTVPETDLAAPPRPPPELAHLNSVVGLVWRSVVLWLVLLALLTLARLLG